MMIVLLRDLSRRRVVRDNLVVTASDHKKIVIVRIKLDDVGHPSIRKGLQTLARLCIP